MPRGYREYGEEIVCLSIRVFRRAKEEAQEAVWEEHWAGSQGKDKKV
jgi:hypothetical protein